MMGRREGSLLLAHGPALDRSGADDPDADCRLRVCDPLGATAVCRGSGQSGLSMVLQAGHRRQDSRAFGVLPSEAHYNRICVDPRSCCARAVVLGSTVATAAEALRYAVEDLRIPKADNRILKRSCFRKSPSPQNAYSFVFFQLSSARLKRHRLLEPGVRRMAQLSR